MRYQENLCNNCPECVGCGLKYENAWVFECDNCDCTVAEEDLVEAPDGSEEEWCKACVNQYEEEQREAELNEHDVDAFNSMLLLKERVECECHVIFKWGEWMAWLNVEKPDNVHIPEMLYTFRDKDFRVVMKALGEKAYELWKEAGNVQKS